MSALPANLRLLCSYGRSTSQLCRRMGLNRQQFNKYLSGQTTPSLSTLRRICDFFGVDETEILLPEKDFAELVRLRPPALGRDPDPGRARLDHLFPDAKAAGGLLERHTGYYHVHFRPDPTQDYVLRTLCRIYRGGGRFLTKSIERHGVGDFAVPSPLKFEGVATESHNRIIVTERERGRGRSFWSTMLVATDYATPSYLIGLALGITPEGSHDLTATRTVWQYLGPRPALRPALEACGIVRDPEAQLAEFIHRAGLGDKNAVNTLAIWG